MEFIIQNNKNVKTVEKALALLEIFKGEKKNELGVTELSKALFLHKNNIFRILSTLEVKGIIEQNIETENYTLGKNIFAIGQKFIEKLTYLDVVKPYAMKLVQKFNETVCISVLRDDVIINIDVSTPYKNITVATTVGKEMPAHVTAAGKILLSPINKYGLENLYKTKSLDRFTKNSITNLKVLQEELEQVFKQGYSISNMEHEKDVISVAVPIINSKKEYLAAISIVIPSFRGTVTSIENDIIPILLEYKSEISQKLL